MQERSRNKARCETSVMLHALHIHAVETILPLNALLSLCFNSDVAEVDRLRTSAALAAACLGLEDSSGA